MAAAGAAAMVVMVVVAAAVVAGDGSQPFSIGVHCAAAGDVACTVGVCIH